MPQVFAFILHADGVVDDTALELCTAANRIDSGSAPVAVVTGTGPSLDAACDSLCCHFAEVWKLADPRLAPPNAELVRIALTGVLPPGAIVLIPHSHFGMDLSPGLSVKFDVPYIPDVIELHIEGTILNAVRQEFGGQVNAHVRCDISGGAVLNIRPGAFKPYAVEGIHGRVLDKSDSVGNLTSRRRVVNIIAAENGDVDITRQAVLVSVGRGIQEAENIGLAEELAEVLGGAVSCSRPVVDARWLDRSRQVGSSGKTVKPKVYLACGISGSFQHLAGLKGKPYIIAINKNARAPIFRVANTGVVDDALEFLPELTKAIREHKFSSQ